MSRIFPRALLLTLLVIQIVTHLAWLPISAHSGQVAIPWMMNRGMALFDTLIEQHAPGSSLVGWLAQSLLPVEPVLATRFANLLLVLAVTVLVYLLARHLSGERAGVAAALAWFWWEPVYGNVMLYFDSLLGFMLLVAAVIWLLPEKRDWRHALLLGLLLGAGTLFKQHGWAAVGLAGLWLAAFQRRPADIGAYIGGALVVPLLIVVVVTLQGTLNAYLYWNWGFNFSGLMVNDPLSGDFLRKLLFTNALVPVFALLPVSAVSRIDIRLPVQRQESWSTKLFVLALYAGGSLTLIPRPGEVHVMGQLPLLAVMSGSVIAVLLAYLQSVNRDRIGRAAVSGLLVVTVLAWGWAGAVAYARTTTGTPAYDEFRPISAELLSRQQPGDTLFILPQTDSTPQLHPLSGLLPPGTWIKGWFWYLAVPGVVDDLLAEWEAAPPTYIVYFPDLIREGQPGIDPLVAFMQARYAPVATFDDITFHGPALLYQVEAAPESE